MPPEPPDRGADFGARRPPDERSMPEELRGPDAAPEELRPIYDRLQADARAWSASVASDASLADYIRSLPRRLSQEPEEAADMSTTRDDPEYPGQNAGSRSPSDDRLEAPGGGFLRGRALGAIAAAILIVALLGGALYGLGLGRGTGTTPAATPTATSPQPTDTPQPTATATATAAPATQPKLTVDPRQIHITTCVAASAQFRVANSGGGTLEWSASASNALYQIAPASGALSHDQQQVVTVLNITLSGQITVAAPGAADAPLTLTITCG